MARRGDEAQAEAFQVVERVVERVDFQFAAVAGAGIHLADRQAAAEPPLRRAVEVARRARQGPDRGHRFCHGRAQALEERSQHGPSRSMGACSLPPAPSREGRGRIWWRCHRSCPEYEQLNDLLQSGKSATMLPSIAASSSGHWNHDASRRWQRSMRPAAVDPQPHQHVAAERFGQRHALARAARRRSRCGRRPAASRSSICSISDRLWSISLMRIQTRALTSPSVSTGHRSGAHHTADSRSTGAQSKSRPEARPT